MAHLLSETDVKVTRVADKLSETVHLMLNDPSTGLYRIQEHVKRSVPTLVEKKVELQNLQSNIQGASYDLDYSLKTVKSINWNPHYTIIQECLKSAIASKTNLQRQESAETSAASYQEPIPQEECLDGPEQDTIEGFICPVCMKVWPNQEELIAHWAETHDSSANDTDE
ncbi:BLOC-1-related complex subunit 8 homolog isoform X2 [Paramuricea clavata]|uniref:BLOC-1-related complex subunit 8 homolog isoform X2 n=1 Tax=Paramuricea clavata TaxID=317549 RepID=A0A7D9DRU3_PARCT|nr:BLOC-1-related complex subunit 8 homolog isoform X2 [Paramuricea clavata]